VIGAFIRDSSVLSWLWISAELSELIVLVIDAPVGIQKCSDRRLEPPACR
jgi:hypothetical protein